MVVGGGGGQVVKQALNKADGSFCLYEEGPSRFRFHGAEAAAPLPRSLPPTAVDATIRLLNSSRM